MIIAWISTVGGGGWGGGWGGGVGGCKVQRLIWQWSSRQLWRSHWSLVCCWMKQMTNPEVHSTGRAGVYWNIKSELLAILHTSGQTILLYDRSNRSKPFRSIIDRKANLRSIICRFFIIVKLTGSLLWKQYNFIIVRLGIWDNSHLL